METCSTYLIRYSSSDRLHHNIYDKISSTINIPEIDDILCINESNIGFICKKHIKDIGSVYKINSNLDDYCILCNHYYVTREVLFTFSTCGHTYHKKCIRKHFNTCRMNNCCQCDDIKNMNIINRIPNDSLNET